MIETRHIQASPGQWAEIEGVLRLIDLGRLGPSLEAEAPSVSPCLDLVPYQPKGQTVVVDSDGWARMPSIQDLVDDDAGQWCCEMGVPECPWGADAAVDLCMDPDILEALECPPLPAGPRGISKSIVAAQEARTPSKSRRHSLASAYSGRKVPSCARGLCAFL